ncbi:hypothetical protein [Rubinisphaera margarita]|uniref:hypothetical protein n=1 Tax=Rubinisphaera margarita TaxID=2909586 RepID=UPI001EE97F35|nr:hypothetical protein [Rubinisphaera margarita]MCG6157173.1 hypothetical protein [Rubinisphaera margarita]
MPQTAVIIGILLVLQGLYGYLGAELDDRSPTALIPLFFGAPILLAGLAAFKHSFRMHAMHVAVLFGLLGAIAGWGRGIMLAIKMSNGADVNSRALTMVFVLAILCTVFVVLCVRSFIAARKRQRAEKETAA